jgi:hypothetical protein
VQIDYRQLCKYCVAIANEGGRYLVLGITNPLPRKVVGTKACSDVTAQAQKFLESLESLTSAPGSDAASLCSLWGPSRLLVFPFA